MLIQLKYVATHKHKSLSVINKLLMKLICTINNIRKIFPHNASARQRFNPPVSLGHYHATQFKTTYNYKFNKYFLNYNNCFINLG